MRAVVYRGPNDLRLERVPVPRTGADELLVKVAVCGVCPTDIKKIQFGTVPPPRIFGHETAGTIVRAGRGAGQFEAGQRVALHHHVPCLQCHACRHRAFAQCAQYKRTGITAGFEPAGGGYAEYVRVMPFVLPGVVSIPDGNSFVEGALLEPVNTVLKAVKRLALLPGDTVLVAGQGPIGLMFTRLLALRGARVVASDLLETRLDLARQFGARHTCAVSGEPRAPEGRSRGRLEGRLVGAPGLPPEGGVPIGRGARASGGGGESSPGPRRGTEGRGHAPGPRSLAELVRRITAGRGLDAAVIAVPLDEVVREAQALVRGGGQVLLFSHTRRGQAASLDLATVCVDEKDLLGSYSSDFLLQAEAAELVFSRQIDARRLVTHQFPLAQTAAAIALASHPSADSLKTVVSVA
jgi:L-iditol 2-dehydrogenase